jgi:hypothetical protein
MSSCALVGHTWLQVMMEEKTLTADIERGMPSDAEIRFEKESEQQPGTVARRSECIDYK